MYDQVFLDGPPALLVSDALVAAATVDGVIIVSHAGATSRGALRRLRDTLDRVGVHVLGVVLNAAETQAGGYFKEMYRDYYDYDESANQVLPGLPGVVPADDDRRRPDAPGRATPGPEIADRQHSPTVGPSQPSALSVRACGKCTFPSRCRHRLQCRFLRRSDWMDERELIAVGRRVIAQEAAGLKCLADGLDESFAAMVSRVQSLRGHLVVTGLGKSGLIARKVAATLTSTGTAATFMHPVEALHGDIGLVGPDDALLAFSKSGNTDELVRFVLHFRNLGGAVIVRHVRAPSRRWRSWRASSCPCPICPRPAR